MKYAYFPGCKIAHHLPGYGAGTEAVCAALGIELVPVEFNCCGWPMTDESLLASIFSSARNLALAGRAGLPILTPCKCCFGQLKKAQARLDQQPDLAREIGRLLAREGLEPARPEVVHLLTVLDRDVGPDKLRSLTVRPLTDLKAACHYGCHALRPSGLTGFDDPHNPTVFERLVQALGAETMDWELRLECCGQPLQGRDDRISQTLADRKLNSARAAGADKIVTACTYCQLQFQAQSGRRDKGGRNESKNGPAPEPVLITDLVRQALKI